MTRTASLQAGIVGAALLDVLTLAVAYAQFGIAIEANPLVVAVHDAAGWPGMLATKALSLVPMLLALHLWGDEVGFVRVMGALAVVVGLIGATSNVLAMVGS